MKDTKIEWAHHTFNPWEGCTKVSPGCANCYAEARNSRFNKGEAINWGKGSPRRRTSAANWKQPIKWNEEAKALDYRPRVFCASLADWLDPEVPIEWLADLLELIRQTPELDWLLLSKRPELWSERTGQWDINHQPFTGAFETQLMMYKWHHGEPPANIWIGTTVEDQERAKERIPELLKIPAVKRFLSCEPLLGRVDLLQIPGNKEYSELFFPLAGEYIFDGLNEPLPLADSGIDWVIVGGESGPNARPMNPDWARDIRDQCKHCGVAFLFKQWGEWVRDGRSDLLEHESKVVFYDDNNPNDFRRVYRVGKKAAGRELDGLTHDAIPQ